MPHHNSVLPAPWNDGESPQILRDGFQTAAQASYRPPFPAVWWEYQNSDFQRRSGYPPSQPKPDSADQAGNVPALPRWFVHTSHLGCGQAGPLDGALIVMQMLAEGFIAVQFIIGHRQVCIAYPDIGAFHPASTFIIAGGTRIDRWQVFLLNRPVAHPLLQKKKQISTRSHAQVS